MPIKNEYLDPIGMARTIEAYYNLRLDDSTVLSSLNFKYLKGKVRKDNVVSNILAGTEVLTDDSTCYIEVDMTGVPEITHNIIGFTAGNIPLYEVTTSLGEITEIVDERSDLIAILAGSGASNLSDLNDVDDTNKAIGKILKVGADGNTHEYVDESGGGGGGVNAYKETFDNSDLVDGVLTINHNLDSQHNLIQVYDNNHKLIIPDEVVVTDNNNCSIDLESYGEIAGDWVTIITAVHSLTEAVDSKINNLGEIDGATEINLSNGTYVKATLTDSVTLSFSSAGRPASGYMRGFVLAFTNNEDITFPVGTKFSGGEKPIISGPVYEISGSIDSSGNIIIYGVLDNIDEEA